MSDLAIWGRRARKLILPTCFVFMRGFFNSYKTKRTLSYYLFTWGVEQRSLHRSFNPTARTCASVHGFVLHRSSINNAGFVAYGVEQEEPWEINMGNEVNTHKGKKRVNEHDNGHPHRISHVHREWGGFICYSWHSLIQPFYPREQSAKYKWALYKCCIGSRKEISVETIDWFNYLQRGPWAIFTFLPGCNTRFRGNWVRTLMF